MIVFGKKCPVCRGKQITARPSASRIALFPAANAFLCNDCHQQLVFLGLCSIGMEHRHYARKKLPPNFLIHISGQNDQYAKIKNISEGGICFNHHYNAAPIANRFVMLNLYNCNDGSSLEQLPTEIVTTSEQALEINGIKTKVVNNCARFVDLNQTQRKVLLTCIAQHGSF